MTPDQYDRPAVTAGADHHEAGEPRHETVIVAAVIVLGAVIAGLDDAAPTSQAGFDTVWRMMSGALIVATATFAGPITVLVAAVGAAVAAGASWPFVPACGAIVLAVFASRNPDVRELEVGAAAGLLISIVVFRLGFSDTFGLESAAGLAIAAALIVVGTSTGPDGLWHLVRAGATIIGAAYLVGVVALLVVAVQSRNDLRDAFDLSDRAIAQFRQGDEQAAERSLGNAVAELRSVDDRLQAPWVRATKALPVLGQHTNVATLLVGDGVDAAAAAEAVLATFDRDAVSVAGGRIDLAEIERITPAVVDFAATANAFGNTLAGIDSPWLIPLVADAVDEVRDEVIDDIEASERAADAVRLAPDMLGAEGRRTYLLVFATPAEARGTVGLLGNWAVLSAQEGQLRLEQVGRIEDLNTVLRARDVALVEPERYAARYGPFAVERQMQDATLSPDFPDVASVVAQLYTEVRGETVDGVILADPFTVSAMLQLTGPVEVRGATVTAGNVADFLLVDQYLEFDDDNERVAFLTELLEATFNALFESDFSDPWDLTEYFDDVVDEGRFAVRSFEAKEQDLLTRLGVTAPFPRADGDDLVGVLSQNAGQNKIDTFMRRRVAYRVELDAVEESFAGTLVVDIQNNAPDKGLPDSIIGSNDQGLALGTNKQLLTIYTQHPITEATVDGRPLPLRVGIEFGVNVATAEISVAAGSSVTVEVRTGGSVPLDDGYQLVVPVQATVAGDQIGVAVSARDRRVDGVDGTWRSNQLTAADQRFDLPIG